MFDRIRKLVSRGGTPKPEAIPEGPNPQFKHASEKWLVAKEIPICNWLGTNEVVLRPAQEVAERALILEAIGETSSGGAVFDSEMALEWIRATGIEHALTPDEREYLEKARDPDQELAMSWRCEAAWALAWALGWTDDLGGFHSDPHYEFVKGTVMEPDGLKWLGEPKLRSEEEIGQAEDLTVRIHWAFRNASIQGRAEPWMADFSLDVILERQWAFAWLIDPETPWDEVTLDT
jgi:hypothetical protein